MKLTTLFLTVAIVQGYASTGLAQKITLSVQKIPLQIVLDELHVQSGYDFLITRSMLNDAAPVDLSVKNTELREVLKLLFENQPLGYTIQNKSVIVYKTETPAVQRQLSGVVTDDKGVPLAGVTVRIKNAQNSTLSDEQGKFNIAIPASDATLSFYMLGFEPRELPVNNTTTNVRIQLKEDVSELQEVMVVGYGTVNKQAITGSVVQADLDTYRDVPTNNILESVKGTVPGLNVGGINSAGAVASLSIRGQNSTAASNEPILVVDGVIYNGTLADISPNDIANFTVLKDASAAAVYGSRSANGVILIETKSGKNSNGKPKFDVNMAYGLSDQLKPVTVYDAKGYLQRVLDIRSTNGQEADPEKIRLYLEVDEQNNYDATPDHRPTLTNPFDVIAQLGSTVNTNINISNSTEKTNYYVSASIIDQKGVVVNDRFKMVSGRANLSTDLTSWWNLGVKTSYSNRDYSGASPDMYWATGFSPYASVYDANGYYTRFPQTTGAFISPFWQIPSEDTDRKNNLSAIVSSNIQIPWVKGLSYVVNYSNAYRTSQTFQFYDEHTTEGDTKSGSGSRIYDSHYNMLLDNLLKYNGTFDKHHVDLTLLVSREHYSYDSTQVAAEGFDNLLLGTYALEKGRVQKVNTGGGGTDALGYMARLNYTYSDKYTITGTIRRDGYSAFGRNKKWGTFPSVGFNWALSREDFMRHINGLDKLAIRASYGTNGNQSIAAYQTVSRVGNSRYVFYGNGGSYSTLTQYIANQANNDLGWEKTTGLNLGVDFSFLNGRIMGSVDMYKTRTTDLLFTQPLPTTSGWAEILSNIGEIRNKGVELGLSTLNISRGKFKWYSDFAFSINRNKVASILGRDNNGDGREDDLVSAGYFIGHPLETIYDYKIIGMWQQEDLENGSMMPGLRPGDYKLEDLNGDNAITTEHDRQFLGNRKENFRWSFTNTFKYKEFSLLLYFYSIWGGNGWYQGLNAPYAHVYANHTAVNRAVYDYWTATNTNARFPRTDYYTSAAYQGNKYMDRSFVKLQKVALSYDASKWVEKYRISGLKLNLSADNLFTYAPYWLGLDPETGSGLSANAVPSIRTWLLSLSFNF